MEKIIEIDVLEENELYQKYNKKEVSKELINYIIESTPKLKKEDTLKIIINSKIRDCSQIIKCGLQKEYKNTISKYKYSNLIQLLYLIFGIVILFISTTIEKEIFREVVLIGGWVFIWSSVELEIFSDKNNRMKRRIIKKLLNSQIIEK